MQYTPNTLFLDSSVPDLDLAVSIYAAYQDIAAGKRAQETCEVLSECLGKEWRVETQFISFKALSISRMRRIAAVEAAKASILVVSCHDQELPPAVKEWTRLLSARDGGPMALVALFSCPRLGARRASASEGYLATTAKKGRMQFFARFESKPATQWEWKGRMAATLGPLGKMHSL